MELPKIGIVMPNLVTCKACVKHVSAHGFSWPLLPIEFIEIIQESSTNWTEPHFSHADHPLDPTTASFNDSFYDTHAGKCRKSDPHLS